MIQNVFIAGAGLMGQGIAHAVLISGMSVQLFDISDDALQSATDQLRWSLEKLFSKNRITESPLQILERLSTTTDLTQAGTADFVIEAAPEKEELKKELFVQLDQLLPEHVVLATNTSAIPISNLAAVTRRADRVCGLHFFNPVPLIPLVEVVRGRKTSDETITIVTRFVESIQKQAVFVNGEQSGFIVNRILGAAMVEAIRILEDGNANAADIDKAMKLGCGWKMGPLETADLVGLDTVMHMCDVMQQGDRGNVFSPPAILRDHVSRGAIGRKSGEGFFIHTKNSPS